MTRQQGTALAAAVIAVIALLFGYFTGRFDDALRMAGLVPPTPAAPSAPAAPAAPAATAEAPKPDAAAKTTVVPVFDLVRVEPTGDAVIAGQGVPNAAVEILSGSAVIAKGTANAAGEWAIVLADPLKAGAHDLTVRATSPGGMTLVSEQSVAVSVPEGGSGEVLVVLNQPGAASTVLQLPGLDETREKLAEAGVAAEALKPAAPAAPAPGTAAPAPAAPDAAASGTAAATAPKAPEPAAEAPAAPAAPEAVASAETPSTATDAAPSGASGSAGAGSAVEATVPPDAPPPPADAGSTVVAQTSDGESSGGESAVTQTPPVPDTATPSAAAPAPAPAAEAAPATAAAPDAATPETPVATAPSADAAPAPAAPAAAPAQAAPAAAAPALVVTIEAVETEGDRLFAAGSAAKGAKLRLYVDDALVSETTADDKARWLVETTRAVTPGSHAVRIDQVDAAGTVIARAEVTYEQADETMAVAGGGSGLAGAGSGSAGEARVGSAKTMIIRRGDNLWRIARRLYGRGVRYSTIYQANSDQIRNPGLIYPGQVFVLPESDEAWTAAPNP